ncbi:MAG: thioredoxin fold domain-containing protein, partial [Sulfurimicrobium sp.]|nr:thioredoxin fold domain-containing protein [Sulfurimicrobium sp.]
MKEFLLGLVFCLFVAPVWAESRDVEKHFFNQHLGDFKAELDTAKTEGKQGILLMFEMEDCPFCHRMKQTILNQPEVQDYYRQHFLIFS